MGGPQERILEAICQDMGLARTADLNTLAVDASPIPASTSLPRLPGLPDDAFRHDGQLTKREIRAATLAALGAFAAAAALGCRRRLRSIAIEWLRARAAI